MTCGDEEALPSSMDQPVSDLKGVGPKRKDVLRGGGIDSLADLLGYFPRRHRFIPAVSELLAVPHGRICTLLGEVVSLVHRRSRRHSGGHLRVRLQVDEKTVVIEFFNQGYLRNTIEAGQFLRVTGVLLREPILTLTPTNFKMAKDVKELDSSALILSDYKAIGALRSSQIWTLVRAGLAEVAGDLKDPIPRPLLQRRKLVSLEHAVGQYHVPNSSHELELASRRLSYNAYLLGALRAEGAKSDLRKVRAGEILRDSQREKRSQSVLPFQLTDGQKEALEEILQDLAYPQPMRRLLQGDVGCGKTAVAAMAALNVGLHGQQVAFLAPTEVLARQIHDVLSGWGQGVGIGCILLVGGMKVREKRQALEQIAKAEGAIVVGTHALFQNPVIFRDLGLVIVDEQHRFGVLQRLRLVRKGKSPHLLAMSATPIPRTLAMTLYSDLKLSSVKHRPGNRLPIETSHHVRDLDGPFAWRQLAARARAGEKCFIVFPGIESENESFPTLLGLGRLLAKRFFKDVPMAAVHGRMKDEDKQKNLQAFRKGDVKVLFATTVIEVGVDVPDAQHIAIVGADRFGLAQLHQLRGRVGRGGLPGFCYLLTKSKKSADSQRLSLLTECDDGFAIAEHDLALRGPGDMMGLKQHGPGPLSAPQADESLLHEAFADARELLQSGLDVDRLIGALERFAPRRRRRSRGYEDAG